MRNLIEICDQYSAVRGDEELKSEEENNGQESRIIEFIDLMKKIEYLTKYVKNESNKTGSFFKDKIDLIKNEHSALIMNLNQHLDKVLINTDGFKKAVEKCDSSSNNIRIPLEQQERFLQYLTQCEKNLKSLSDDLNLYDKFNLSLHLNGGNLQNFSHFQNQFYEFYQNLQNEIEYFSKFHEKFVKESKIMR